MNLIKNLEVENEGFGKGCLSVKQVEIICIAI